MSFPGYWKPWDFGGPNFKAFMLANQWLVDPAPLAVPEAAADEATFQIARTLNRSRADSRPARMRWWRVYAAFDEIYREAAAKVWQRSIIDARKRA